MSMCLFVMWRFEIGFYSHLVGSKWNCVLLGGVFSMSLVHVLVVFVGFVPLYNL